MMMMMFWGFGSLVKDGAAVFRTKRRMMTAVERVHVPICIHIHVRVRAAVLCVFCGSLQRGYPAYLDLGDPVDTCVGDHHDRHGDVETDQRGGDGVGPTQT